MASSNPIDYARLTLHTLRVGPRHAHTIGLAKKNRARFLDSVQLEVYGDPPCTPSRDMGQSQPDRAGR